jgi:hypothetical protein
MPTVYPTEALRLESDETIRKAELYARQFQAER